MKIMRYIGVLLFALLMGMPGETEAQARKADRVIVVQGDRHTVRKERRHKRRVRRRVVRRTLRSLPAGTRAVIYNKLSWYPVGGRYYLARKGVYVRAFPPVGFRTRILAVAPVRIVVRNRPYWYAEGVFYEMQGEDYVVAETPVGAVVPELPGEAGEIDMDGVTNYELNNAVYRQVENGYEIIELLEGED